MAVVGYLRVSATDQNLARQHELVGQVDRSFEEKISGATTQRPALSACLDYLRDGDTLRVASIDRLARDSRDLHALVAQLNAKGVTACFVEENLTIAGDDAVGNLVMSIFAAVAEFERRKIKERQRQGIDAAKLRGAYVGRGKKRASRKLTDEEIGQARSRKALGVPHSVVAQELGVPRSSLYDALAGRGRYATGSASEDFAEPSTAHAKS